MEELHISGAPVTIHAPEPMPRHWLEAVHCPSYVEEVFTATVPRAKERRIGFPVTPHIASRVRHTNGGTWLAAKLALVHGYAANSAQSDASASGIHLLQTLLPGAFALLAAALALGYRLSGPQLQKIQDDLSARCAPAGQQ